MAVEVSQMDQIYDHMKDELEIDKCVKAEESEVQKYYADKTLFITGATGFMGKCLVEKLLRSCPDLRHIYILLRQKKTASIEERLEKYFQHEIFNLLRTTNPDFAKKVTAIKGELFVEKLGLSEEDAELIKKETNIIFHNAANVKFEVKINVSLRVNVIGTKNMLDLAEECENLESFMYVSTGYSHCYRKCIEEKFYSSPGDLKMVYDMINSDINSEEGLTEESLKMLLGEHPNIYTFTKAIAEELVRQRSVKVNFACGVYRPTIVISTFKEPLAGWNGNLNGPVTIFLGGGLGVFHTAYHFGYPMDFIPCDMAINGLIVTTSDLPKRWALEKKAVIYNYGSSSENPISLMDVYDYLKHIDGSERSSYAVWMNFGLPTKHFWLFVILHFLFHFIPACILDIGLMLTGRKPIAVSVFLKATRHMDKIDYFGNGNWRIYMHESRKAIDRLNSVDKELFFCDVRQIDWESYCLIMWRGLRLYLLKESLNSDVGMRRYTLLWYLHYGLITVLLLAFSYYVMRFIPII